MQNKTIHLFLTFLSSEFMDTVLVTFAGIALVLIVDTLSMTECTNNNTQHF